MSPSRPEDRDPVGAPSCAHAVLVPLIERAGELSITFLVRPDRPDDPYGGQVCFPGGRREPSDESLAACALRETWEELGIPPEKVELIAEIGCHRTRLHRAVKPFAGIVREPFPLAPSPREVERVLYLPAKKLDDELFEPRRVVARGQPFDSIGFELDGTLVWGLTARVLRAFYVDSPAFRRAIRAAS